MAIINLYEEFKKGSNIFNDSIKENFGMENEDLPRKEIVFLSHKSIDKNTARKIEKYLEFIGYDIYLDENDEFLQIYAEEDNKKEIVDAINIAIEKSTYLLCIVSSDTVKSWWVPFEIGVAHAKNKKIVSLCPGESSDIDLPEFLEIHKILQKESEFSNFFQDKSNNTKNFLGHFLKKEIYYRDIIDIFIQNNKYLSDKRK